MGQELVKSRALWLVAACATLMLAGSAPAYGEFAGSAHDFSGEGWSGGESCAVCHTPHTAAEGSAGQPLWDHAESPPDTAYQVYDSDTLDAAPLNPPTASSRLCLSCHDGTVAVDSFGGQLGSVYVTGGALVGTNLSLVHPISIDYVDGSGTGMIPRTNPSVALLLISGSVECTSCHDLHGGVPGTKLLVVSNAASALCLTCHNK